MRLPWVWGRIRGFGQIGAPVEVLPGGEVACASGQTLDIRSTGRNQGAINLAGGTLALTEDLVNEVAGFISGSGTLSTGHGLVNRGRMYFKGPWTRILGNAENTLGSEVTNDVGGLLFYIDDLVHDGLLTTNAGAKTFVLGTLSGNGTFAGDGEVWVQGVLMPGSSPGTLTFEGPVTLDRLCEVTIEIDETLPGGYDHLAFADQLTVLGSLAIDVDPGYVPAFGDTFEVLTYGSLAGQFEQITGLDLGNGWSLVPDFGPRSMTMTVVPEPATSVLLTATLGVLTLLRRRRPRLTENGSPRPLCRHAE